MVRMAAGTSLHFCMAFASQQFCKVSETQGQDPSQGISTRCLSWRPGVMPLGLRYALSQGLKLLSRLSICPPQMASG